MRRPTFVFFLALFLSHLAHAQFFVVGAGDDVFLSGGNTFTGSNGLGNPPTAVFAVKGGQIINFFNMGGSWSCAAESGVYNGPDGGPCGYGSTNAEPIDGKISGIIGDRTMFLTGVFLGTSLPAVKPASLNFTSSGLTESFLSLSPGLGQVFFIGDGLTGTGTGTAQTFIAPVGATTLSLGAVDLGVLGGVPGDYEDNAGSVNGTIAISNPTSPKAQPFIVNAGDDVFLSGGNTFTGSNGLGNPPTAFFAVKGGQIINFSNMGGSWSCAAESGVYNGPDGGTCGLASTNAEPTDGKISGIIGARSFFLTGVFLGTSLPAVRPSSLNFTSSGLTESFLSLSPELGQVFFIGDGLTGTGSGNTQTFIVPAEATTLYLGAVDVGALGGVPGDYEDNYGSVNGTIAISNPNSPNIYLSGIITGPPKQVQITSADLSSGLSTIDVLECTNCTAQTGSFMPSTFDPVITTATKTNQSQSSSVKIKATDVAGNSTVFDPADITIEADGKMEEHVLRISSDEHVVLITNGTPGIHALTLKVRNTVIPVLALQDGQSRTLDIGFALQPGEQNRVEIFSFGSKGAAASIVFTQPQM